MRPLTFGRLILQLHLLLYLSSHSKLSRRPNKIIFDLHTEKTKSRYCTLHDLTDKLLVLYEHVKMVRLNCLCCGTEIDKSMPDVGENMELSNGFNFLWVVFGRIKWEPRKSNRSEIIIKTYLLSIIVLVQDSNFQIGVSNLCSLASALWNLNGNLTDNKRA